MLEVPVRAGADDAEERSASVSLTGTDLELVDDLGTVQTVGLRFTDVTVPRGATIANAYLQFAADEVQTGPASLTVAGQSADNPASFAAEAGNISSRPRTSATVAWQPAAWPTIGLRGVDQRTPNLSAVVQEIVARSGWTSGNAMAFVITGTGTRTAEAFEGEGAVSKAPTLHIEYASAPTTGPVAGTAVERYITKVYNDLFQRDPDSTGMSTWSNALTTGTPYGAVANGITYSREFRSRLISASYGRYLGRGPDAAGLESWLGEMQRGMHIEQMQAGFISSPEFYLQAGSDDRRWIANLYQTVLRRAATSPEIDFWQGQLRAGVSRNGVALGFVYSTEYLTSVVDGYYRDLLGRAIDPTGRQTWVTAIQRGARDEEIIANIVSSVEYRQKV
jgi:hypothetical protein